MDMNNDQEENSKNIFLEEISSQLINKMDSLVEELRQLHEDITSMNQAQLKMDGQLQNIQNEILELYKKLT